MIRLVLLMLLFISFSFGIDGYSYGVLPTEVDLNMTVTDYTNYMGMLGIACGIVFWLGWNSNT